MPRDAAHRRWNAQIPAKATCSTTTHSSSFGSMSGEVTLVISALNNTKGWK
jgi:hypothetical protein